MHDIAVPLNSDATSTTRAETDNVLHIAFDIHPSKFVSCDPVDPFQDVFLQALVNCRIGYRRLAHAAQDDTSCGNTWNGICVLRSLKHGSLFDVALNKHRLSANTNHFVVACQLLRTQSRCVDQDPCFSQCAEVVHGGNSSLNELDASFLQLDCEPREEVIWVDCQAGVFEPDRCLAWQV